uniref:Uncharacterized protein n=1 Tax=Tetraselmis sp. GSL018 TaxID=582737 RepID=A0A061RBS0_9CHLO
MAGGSHGGDEAADATPAPEDGGTESPELLARILLMTLRCLLARACGVGFGAARFLGFSGCPAAFGSSSRPLPNGPALCIGGGCCCCCCCCQCCCCCWNCICQWLIACCGCGCCCWKACGGCLCCCCCCCCCCCFDMCPCPSCWG